MKKTTRSNKQIRKLQNQEMWSGVTLAATMGLIIMFFAYYMVFQQNDTVFWVFVAIAVLFLMYQGWKMVKQDGAGFIGYAFGQ